MSVETATYISDLNTSLPAATDPKSEGDDHIRLTKSAVKATFPNVTGAVTATHTELNKLAGATASTTELNKLAGLTASTAELNKLTGATVTTSEINRLSGVTSPVQTQIDAKAPLASPALTGTPTAPTAPATTNTTQLATTEMVQAAILASSGISGNLPGQAGNSGKFLTTNGTIASWASVAYGAAVDTFNASGTWTKPANCNFVYVEVVGGGKAGNRNTTTGNIAGGVGGAWNGKLFRASDVPSSVTVTVGLGGTATTSTGNVGGDTTFGTLLTGKGGGNGYGADGFSNGTGTSGGVGTNTIKGGAGGGGAGSATGFAGGTSVEHGAGGSGSYGGTAGNGVAPGGGGGAAANSGTAGNGANGICVVLAW